MLKNNLVSNNKVGRNSVYGKVYMPSVKESYGARNTMRKLKHKRVFGKNKETYGSKGQYTIDR